MKVFWSWPSDPAETAAAPTRFQALAALAAGSLVMVLTGLQRLLLTELADLGRIDHGLIHPAALTEMVCMALGVAACAHWLPPVRQRWIGGCAAVVCLLAAAGAVLATDDQVLLLRALGGAGGGVVIWITVGMIARQARPEPWAAAFFLIQSAGQVFAAGLMASVLLPAFGALGGLALGAVLATLAAVCILFGPPAQTDLARPTGGRVPTARGLVALAALFFYFAGSGALWFQMSRLAVGQVAGPITGLAVLANLSGQMIGAVVAMALADRIAPRRLFGIVASLGLIALGMLSLGPPAAIFILAYGVAGFAALLLGASLFSLLRHADPSLRTSAISPAAQLTAAALGPMLAALAWRLGGFALSLPAVAVCILAACVCAGFSLRPDGSVSRDSE